MANAINKTETINSGLEKGRGENGFTLVEAMIAIFILTIALLSAATMFAYATKRNTGNNTRSQALAVLQQEIEVIRALKFTPTSIDPPLTGGTKAARTVTVINNGTYSVQVWVDDNPNLGGIQIDNTTTLKEITIEVTGPILGESWASAVPSRAVFRRVRAN
ncbi:MAG TPA: prepilin-type N-terminal cleavage/methylation domain-containing protein [Pyrinomonadaceae bacterium]|jgi:prepilin-type N-terminal cleavage/methylation domain-containing protein